MKPDKKSTGKLPEKSPHWVSLDRLCRSWVEGEQHRTGNKGLLAKYATAQKNRSKTSSYEAACWGALNDCKLHDAARNLQMMCLDQKLPMRIVDGAHEIYLGFVESVDHAIGRASHKVRDIDNAIAAHRQRVNAKGSRAPAKVRKSSPAQAAARTAPKRQPTRG